MTQARTCRHVLPAETLLSAMELLHTERRVSAWSDSKRCPGKYASKDIAWIDQCNTQIDLLWVFLSRRCQEIYSMISAVVTFHSQIVSLCIWIAKLNAEVQEEGVFSSMIIVESDFDRSSLQQFIVHLTQRSIVITTIIIVISQTNLHCWWSFYCWRVNAFSSSN